MTRLVIILVGLVLCARGAGAQTAPPDGGSGSATGEGAPKDDEARAAIDGLATRQQPPTVRGGTLGIPAVSRTEGLQATASSQVLTKTSGTQMLPDKADFDFMAKLGGLQLFDSFSIDILAERYKQDLPHVDLLNRPILARMMLTDLHDVGIRLRYSTARNIQVTKIRQRARAAPELDGSAKDSAAGQFLLHHELTLTGGARYLQRPGDAPGRRDFQGGSLELIGQYSRTKRNSQCQQASKDTAKATIEVVQAKLTAARNPTLKQSGRDATPSINALTARLSQAKAALDKDEIDAADEALQYVAHGIDEISEITTMPPATPPATLDPDTPPPATPSPPIAPDPATAPEAITPSVTTPPATTPPGATLPGSTLLAKTPPGTMPPGSTPPDTTSPGALKDSINADIAALNSCTDFGGSVFLGISSTMLHTETLNDEMHNTEDPLFKELRVTMGGDLQTLYGGLGTTLLPRFGAYATMSWAAWQNRFAVPGAARHVDAFQLEAALYVSGHFASGLDVLVSFVALKPYGQGPTEFLINVAPALGAILGGK